MRRGFPFDPPHPAGLCYSVLMKRQINLWGIPVTYHIVGRGNPVIFLHGHRADVDKWWVFVERLAQSFKVYAPELPGMGGITPPFKKEKHTLVTYAQFVAAFLKRLNPTPTGLVGASLGGAIGLYLLRDYPQYFTKALFFWTPVDQSSYHVRKAKYSLPLIRLIARGGLALKLWQVFVNSSLLRLFTSWDTPKSERRGEILDDEMNRWRSADLLAWSQSLLDLLTINFHSQKSIDIPLVAVFTPQDRYLSLENSRQLFSQYFSNLKSVEVRTPGHVPKGKLNQSFIGAYEQAFKVFEDL